MVLRLGQRIDIAGAAGRLRGGRWRIQIRRIGEIEEEADVWLGGIARGERLQAKTLFDEAQDGGRIHRRVVNVMWFGKW